MLSLKLLLTDSIRGGVFFYMNYLERFLGEYEDFIEDYDALLLLLSLLPPSYVYSFVLKLLEYDQFLEPGDLVEGKALVGRIFIHDYKICLESELLPSGVVCLLKLPPSHEVI